MEDILKTIKAAADENDGVVSWDDVDDEVTSGQWGRVIEEGILESADGGFRFTDPERVEELLGSEDIESEIDLEMPDLGVNAETSWTTWDKAAGGATALLVLGYWFDPVQAAIGNTVNIIFGPLHDVLPFFAVIFAAALVTGMYSTLLQANLMNMDVISAYQNQMKEVQRKKSLAEERGNDEAVQRIEQMQMDMVTEQLGMFKEQFRPMVWIMLLTIPIFLWIWWMVGQGAIGHAGADIVMPMIGPVENWNDGVVGPLRAWILWYIVCSISFTQVMRKSLNLVNLPG